MTAIIFYSAFIGVYGFIIGKTFKRLNPFLMIIGMMFTFPLLIEVERQQQPLLYIPFGIGFLTNFGNPFRKVIDFFAGIKYSIQDSIDQRRYRKEQKRRDKERAKQARENARQEKQEAKRNRQYQKQSSTNNYTQQQRQAQEDIYRHEKEAQERIKRQAEELRRQREQFQREQAQARNNQANQSKQSSSNDDLNPNIFKDACEILGCTDTDNKATLKKAYRRLSAMYHPDKSEKLGKRRREQAEEEMKLINLAWARVQKNFR